MRSTALWGVCWLWMAASAGLTVGVQAAEPPLDGREGRPLSLENFRPRAMLKVDAHPLTRARFPVVDCHVHPRIRLKHSSEDLAEFVRVMDVQNIAVCVSLDGESGVRFDEHVQYLWKEYRDRFVIFANIDWRGDGREDEPATWDMHRPDFPRRTVAMLEEARKKGASGLKIFKQFGLGYKNPDGGFVAIDDPRWTPIWEACGRLGLVVLIHTADPAAFFEPINEQNERWEELHRHPEWSFYGEHFPKRDDLLAARNRVIASHPETTFIAAHFGNDAEDLNKLAQWLDAYPNMNVDLAARIAELGRQPYTARAFFVRYRDRILFATDGPRSAERLYPHWRFLETLDEYFPYAENPFPPQGLWNIYGLGLPEEILKQVYYENAARLIPGVRERWEKFSQR